MVCGQIRQRKERAQDDLERLLLHTKGLRKPFHKNWTWSYLKEGKVTQEGYNRRTSQTGGTTSVNSLDRSLVGCVSLGRKPMRLQEGIHTCDQSLGCRGPGKDSGFYSPWDEKPLVGLGQRNDFIRLCFKINPSSCYVENWLRRRQGWKQGDLSGDYCDNLKNNGSLSHHTQVARNGLILGMSWRKSQLDLPLHWVSAWDTELS